MPDQEMMHGTISTTEQNLLVDVNAQDKNRYLGKNGWTTLEDARRFSAEDAGYAWRFIGEDSQAAGCGLRRG